MEPTTKRAMSLGTSSFQILEIRVREVHDGLPEERRFARLQH